MMLGTAIPYNAETVIGELLPNGERVVYREVFDQRSWTNLPKRVPWLRSHQSQASPLGWAQVNSRPAGLAVCLEPVAGSSAATDAVAEVRAGVLRGLSVGFWQNPDMDEIDARDRHRLPLVRRRGATLREVSLTLQGAYSGAGITSVDVDADAHAESERLLEPMRRQLAAEAEERRRQDQLLLDWVDQVEPAETVHPAEPPPAVLPAGQLVRVGARRFRVADGQDAGYAAGRYVDEVARALHHVSRALDVGELTELQARCGLVPIP
jgi:HK97 family phage prohead protease